MGDAWGRVSEQGDEMKVLMSRFLAVLALVGLAACGGKDPEDTSETGDMGNPTLTGFTGRLGAATVTSTDFDGTEDWYFAADETQGGR